jgi:hypothetical protein
MPILVKVRNEQNVSSSLIFGLKNKTTKFDYLTQKEESLHCSDGPDDDIWTSFSFILLLVGWFFFCGDAPNLIADLFSTFFSS